MPEWLASLFRSGAVADIAIAVLVIECLGLLVIRQRLNLATGPILFNAVSGIALLLALRGALVNPQGYLWIGMCLSAGFVAHIGDLWTRRRT